LTGAGEAPTKQGPSEVDEERGHTKAQWQLARIARALHLDAWIPRADRYKVYRSERLGDLSVESLPSLGLPRPAQDVVEYIDVLWIDDGLVVCAFEVEHSTAVYSGLLRLSDLVTVQPYTPIRLFVVADEARRPKFARELTRPTFARVRLAQRCRFLSYERLEEHARFAEAHGRYLKFDWVEQLAEALASTAAPASAATRPS
jgi:hypothetical protein